MCPAGSDTATLADVYRDLVLEHARKPHNFGSLESPSHQAAGINPLCGDKIHVYLDIGADSVIRQARFEGNACAITLASASMMTDLVIDETVLTARTRSKQAFAWLDAEAADAPEPALDVLRALGGVKQFPSRVKCATLPWRALDASLEQAASVVSTE